MLDGNLVHAPLRCPGPGGCADPLQCSAALVETALPSQESSGATEPARRRRSKYCFALAWRLRRAEIQGLARRGRMNSGMVNRIPVPMGTTLCERWFPEDVTLAHGLLQRASIYQMFYQRGQSAVCVERLVDLVLQAWGRAYMPSPASVARGRILRVQKRRRHHEHWPRSTLAEHGKGDGGKAARLASTA